MRAIERRRASRRCSRARYKLYAERAAASDDAAAGVCRRCRGDRDRRGGDDHRDPEGRERAAIRARHVAGLVGTVTRTKWSWTFRSATSARWRSRNSTPPSCSRMPRSRPRSAATKVPDRRRRLRIITRLESIDRRSSTTSTIRCCSSSCERDVRAEAKDTGVMPCGVGYQDMGGRMPRYRCAAGKGRRAASHRDITLTKRWMDAIGVDVAVTVPDADAAARRASAGRGRGRAVARL